ncbi:BppU family phage baseplate upper protein [Clostridium perfringens]|uniref:BppU family phage baseplate upper protein n=1 Tax=Clostridium perfringens TaxID=1502 RepID=UPI001CCF2BEC|nr:BppU family phage baseplate upper protein [Clostridium perfringens]UBK64750.1 BppU family phage baseplate upper protein [Clostridium perfringens]
MSEIGLNINVDSYNNEGIKTIKGNNNAEIYKLYILKNKRRLSLVGKTVKLGYVMVGTTNGDVIENLNITNAEQGEITFPITNRISKKDGVYSCQLAIYGADGFLEHTATFGLTVEANIFTKIAGEIVDSKDFTYLENILDKASKLSEKLKENTSSATNANSNLESNITEANNINSKLLENTSTATSLNKNLESNINLAKEVKETIKDLDTKNIEATEKIETLTGLNSKAEELSDNINKGLPLNSELVKNVESAKTANNELIATNNDAKAKKTDLDNSLEEAKKFIEGLDGSQNIPQIRMDVTELQNGLKSNQALAYTGSSISADNTLEGRTESMRVKGKTMYKKADGTYTDTWEEGVTLESFGEKEGNKISILSHGKNLFNVNETVYGLLNVKTGELFNSNESKTSNYIKVKKNKNYVISGDGEIRTYYGIFCNSNKQYISQKEFKKNIPINFDEDGYFRFSYASEKDNSATHATNIMFEEGTQATSYELYKCDKKDILIKEPLREGDVLCEDNGQVKIDRYVGIRKYQEGDEKNKDVITDKINTVYILDKPVTEIVENCVDIDLDTFGEKTYFNILNSLPGTLDFKVPSNIASIVQSNSKAINELYNLIDTLVLPNILQNTTDIEMLKLEKLK